MIFWQSCVLEVTRRFEFKGKTIGMGKRNENCWNIEQINVLRNQSRADEVLGQFFEKEELL